MKKQIVKIGLMVFTTTLISGNAVAQKKKKNKNKMETTTIELKTEVDSVSYAIGMNMIESIKRDFPEANFDAFIAGAKAVANNDTNTLIKKEELEAVIAPYFQKKQAKIQAEQAGNAEELKADPEVSAKLSDAEIDDKFDLGYHTKHVDTIFKRVFGE